MKASVPDKEYFNKLTYIYIGITLVCFLMHFFSRNLTVSYSTFFSLIAGFLMYFIYTSNRIKLSRKTLAITLIIYLGLGAMIKTVQESWINQQDYYGTYHAIIMFASGQIFGALLGSLVYARERIAKESKNQEVDSNEIYNFTNKLLSSDQFFNAFNEALPVGKNDKDKGMDHIPYIIKALELRRGRLAQQANKFFNITIALGILFTLILLSFSYVILDERFTGTGRRLANLENSTAELATQISYVRQDEFELTSGSFLKDLDELKNFASSLNQRDSLIKSTLQFFDSEYRAAIRIKDLISIDKLTDSLSLIRIPEYSADSLNLAKFEAARLSIMTMIDGSSSQRQNLNYIIQKSNRILDQFNDELDLEQNKLSSLINRIALTLAVSGFFLAIIRQTSRIYQQYQRQVFQADRDDMAIRQFYVALKSANGDADSERVVLKEFMKIRDDSVEGISSIMSNSGDPTKIAKDMLNAVMKSSK